ncbi:MAG: DNA primase [Nitrospirae bacterium]|nr:DNA primase [Nitrospirota bacterium]
MAIDFQSLKDEIKDRADIVEVISQYVQLKKAGSTYKGLCPFHAEKTPSFTVNPQKQVFHCFGCGTGGDILAFLMKQERVNFFEAMQLLAERVGVKIPNRDTSYGGVPPAKRELQRNILNAAKDFFVVCLTQSKTAREYLNQRGISPDTIRIFSLGYAPEGKDTLYRHLKQQGCSDQDVREAAVVNVKDDHFFDTFRGRIMFPINNAHGETVAFGGRAIGDLQPKYLNSAETAQFKKSRTLFGLNLAKDSIRTKEHAILVEGYIDAITCFQYGWTNVVAPLGTAFTEDHAKVLKRYTQSVLVVLDGDRAGIAAARRAMATIYKNGMAARAVLLPEGGDPDSFLREKGAQAFTGVLAGGKELVEFFLSTGGKGTENLRALYEIFTVIEDTVLKSKLLSELSDKAFISETILREGMKNVKPGGHSPQGAANSRPYVKTGRPDSRPSHYGNDGDGPQKVPTPVRRKLSDEEVLLSIYLCFPDEASSIKDKLDVGELKDAMVKKIFTSIFEKKAMPTFDSISALSAAEELPLLSGLMVEPFIDREKVEENVEWYIHAIKKRNVDSALKELDIKRNIAENNGDYDLVNSLLMEQRELLAKKQSLEKNRPLQNY